ncbi:L-aspartate oxidase [bacterium]|nr:L-aspartate oxidase [bacterium]
MSNMQKTDVLVIGCGIAGGTVALKLADKGIPVTVVTRTNEPVESNTYYAQGGVVYKGEKDTPEKLAQDIMKAGADHSDLKAVNILANEGPELVEEFLIKRIGVSFDKLANGHFSFAKEGGHTEPRIIHVADATGVAIEDELVDSLASHPNINLLKGMTAIDFIKNKDKCLGGIFLDQKTEKTIQIFAKKTILATGGFSSIYLHTANPAGARGDGLAMAERAGIKVKDLEYVQFHPTVFHMIPESRFLISEAVRGAGARIVKADGTTVMDYYDKERKDMATRDVVARCIYEEIEKHNLEHLYLDLYSYIPKKAILERFPNIYETCLNCGVDITKELVPVIPAAHYACGGVVADEWGRTSLENLYALGEVACTGVQGANRLASTSLLEGMVFANRTQQDILENPGNNVEIVELEDIETSKKYLPLAMISRYMKKIKSIMWHHVGIIRTIKELKMAVEELEEMSKELDYYYTEFELTDDLIGLRNACTTGVMVTKAALANEQSLGCHCRRD